MEYLELTRINGCEESLLLDNCRPFKIITEKLTVDTKKVILDLGMANSNNINFFADFYCKIYIEDLFDSIFQETNNNDNVVKDDDPKPKFHKMFYCDETEKVDIVLCWELLNYIPQQYLRLFIEVLLRFSTKETLFHAFIATQDTMADRPLEYSIIDNLTMERNTTTVNRVQAPRYNQLQLYKFMPEFKVIKSILHRNGMQEYLFSVK